MIECYINKTYKHFFIKKVVYIVRIRTTIDENSHTQTTAKFGKNVRSSLRKEYAAILDMKELVQRFKGRVDLVEPMCKIYILDGLQSFFFHNDQQKTCNNNNSSDNSSDDNNLKTNKLLTKQTKQTITFFWKLL